MKQFRLFCRYYSISQMDLVRSSRRIQEILFVENQNERNHLMKIFFDDLQMIHNEYKLKSISQLTKHLYETNSSKFNEKYFLFEEKRKSNENEFFSSNHFDQCLIHLRYYRYLQITSIYRFITFNLDRTIEEINHFVLQLIEKESLSSSHFNSNVFRYEFSFFVYSSSLSKRNSFDSIQNYFLHSLNLLINEKRSSIEIDEICSTLNSIKSIPNENQRNESSRFLFEYLFSFRSSPSNEFLRYLFSIENSSKYSNSIDFIEKFDRYLNEFPFDQNSLKNNYHFLLLISSMNFSHQLFHQNLLRQIQFVIDNAERKEIRKDLKMFCHLICLLCSTDPSNQFSSREIILSLADRINEIFDLKKDFQFIHWIVQSQHSMMLINLYNYSFLRQTIQQKSLPILFRQTGSYSTTIRRQIFELQQILKIDRNDFHSSLFNEPTTRFLQQIYQNYQQTIRSKCDTNYFKYLHQIKDSFNEIYGNNRARIINTEKEYPYLIHDFLQIEHPDRQFLRSIQINDEQRIVLLPILNPMLIRQKRSDGKFYRIFNAQTTMRFRIISKLNFLVLPIFVGQYHRAKRDQQLKDFFDKCFIDKTQRQSSNSFLD